MLKLKRTAILKVMSKERGTILDSIIFGSRKVNVMVLDPDNNIKQINGTVVDFDGTDKCLLIKNENGDMHRITYDYFIMMNRSFLSLDDLTYSIDNHYVFEMGNGELIGPGAVVSILDKHKHLIYDEFKIHQITVDENKKCKIIGLHGDDNINQVVLDFGVAKSDKNYTEVVPNDGNSIALNFMSYKQFISMYNFDFYDYISKLTVRAIAMVKVTTKDGKNDTFVVGTPMGTFFGVPVKIFNISINKNFLVLWYDKKNKKVAIVDLSDKDTPIYWVNAYDVFKQITNKDIEKIEVIDTDSEEVINQYAPNSIVVIDTETNEIIGTRQVGEDIIFFSCDDNENPYITAYGELIKYNVTQTSVKYTLNTEYAGKVVVELAIKDMLRGEIKDVPVLKSTIL